MPEGTLAALPPWWPHAERSRMLDAGGLSWHVQTWPRARAPVALLLHGTGASAHSWRHLAPLLAQDFYVVAPDLPGHGFTLTPPLQALSLPAVADAVTTLLSRLHMQPALVVGHSAGAAIALRMGLDGRIGPALTVSLNGAILPLQGRLGNVLLPAARALAGNRLSAALFASWAALPPVTRRLLDSTGSRIDALGERCYTHLVADRTHAEGALRLMASWDLLPLKRDLRAWGRALLLVAALNDRTLAPSHAQRVLQRVRHATLVELPGLGHLAHEEDAAAVMAPLRAAWAAYGATTA
jgi:magnesium chelatase accessory protein